MDRAQVERIARSRTSLSQDEIASATTRALWDQIYAVDKSEKPADNRETYFPTGFALKERKLLEEEAERLGFRKTSGVNGKTNFVVTGSNPGVGRLQKAVEHGCQILTRHQFLAYARHGVVDASD